MKRLNTTQIKNLAKFSYKIAELFFAGVIIGTFMAADPALWKAAYALSMVFVFAAVGCLLDSLIGDDNTDDDDDD